MIVLDFIATLIASMIGVYVAFRLGIRHERQKKEQDDRERQRQLLTAIKKELQTNLDFLNQLDKEQVSRGAHMFLWTNAYGSGVSGGDLTLLDSQLQTRLGFMYLQFKQLDRYGQKLIDIRGVPGTEETEKEFLILMEDTAKKTLEFIPLAIQTVDSALKQLGDRNSYLEDSSDRQSVSLGAFSQNQGASGLPRDVESEKLKFFWDYERSILNSMLVMIFSAFIAAATILNAQVASPIIHLNPYYEDSALFLIFVVILYYFTGLTVRFKKLIIKTDGLLAELKSGKTITNLRDLVKVETEPISTWKEIVSGYGRLSIPALIALAVIFFIIGILYH